MTIPRFLLPLDKDKLKKGKGTITIRDEKLHHLKRVLRAKAGDMVIIYDGKGLEAIATITSLGKDEAKCKLTKMRKYDGTPSLEITLAQGLLKKDKMELVIEKATELGVSNIIPLITERSNIKIPENRVNSRTERWKKIAESASSQSGRINLPAISEPRDLSDILLMSEICDLQIILWEMEKSETFKTILKSKGSVKKILILTGPAGGFTLDEVIRAKKKNFIAVSLGKRTLRAETSSIAALTILQYELENLI